MFTLVIPCFNRKRLVAETIRSALAQRGGGFSEIIVVDDGSTDGMAEFVRQAFPSVRVIIQDNSGVQVARNRGILAAKTQWVVICDSDDTLHDSYLEATELFVRKYSQVAAVYVNFRNFDEYGVQVDKFSLAPSGYWDRFEKNEFGFFAQGQQSCHALLQFHPLLMAGLAINRWKIGVDFFSPCLKGVRSEDLEFTLRILANNKVGVIERPLAYVRRHPGNDTYDVAAQLIGDCDVLRYCADNHPWFADNVDLLRIHANHRALEAVRVASASRQWAYLAQAAIRFDGKYESLRDIAKVTIGKFLYKVGALD